MFSSSRDTSPRKCRTMCSKFCWCWSGGGEIGELASSCSERLSFWGAGWDVNWHCRSNRWHRQHGWPPSHFSFCFRQMSHLSKVSTLSSLLQVYMRRTHARDVRLLEPVGSRLRLAPRGSPPCLKSSDMVKSGHFLVLRTLWIFKAQQNIEGRLIGETCFFDKLTFLSEVIARCGVNIRVGTNGSIQLVPIEHQIKEASIFGLFPRVIILRAMAWLGSFRQMILYRR